MNLYNAQELINYTGFVNQTCKNLFNATGINHFSYVEVNKQGQFFWLGSDSDYLEKCINQDLVAIAPVSILKTYPKAGFYLIDLYQEEYKQFSLPVFQLLNHFDYGHSFRILEITPEHSVKLYSFDAPLEKHEINHIYINNLELLKKFNNYFEDKIAGIRGEIYLNQIKNLDYPEFENLFNASLNESNPVKALPTDFYSQDARIQITPREKEILFWYIKGKTSDETASLLNVSRRTIERHFENLREKFGCFSKNQIALKVMNMF
ncbi:helix-turn-helix transcriptional regulator [Legionella cardiaca]|uniref:Helix-turn-helix domain-containing protein n=1 Tax=Legionella cardiaca TaxID=1071983 RepID=A0ABY8AVU4_9GAMM|nr:helix-turn-helix domain-containing protein [Legionella cardiaca]WED44291.1 helix-turn-helix domain-containing protein [Legionella cardiaca]